MAVDIEKVIEVLEASKVENEKLREALVKKDAELDELKKSTKELAKMAKEIEPYLDIIEAEDKKNYIINISDGMLYRQLQIQARKVMGPDGTSGYKWRKFIETLLTDAIGIHWTVIRTRRFTNNAELTQVANG